MSAAAIPKIVKIDKIVKQEIRTSKLHSNLLWNTYLSHIVVSETIQNYITITQNLDPLITLELKFSY